MKHPKPTLFATLGFPGSGKTFFAMKFAKDFNIFHLNSDRVRSEIFPNPEYSAKENAVVFRIMDFIAEELLSKGIGVIYDANSTKRKYRKRLQKIAQNQKARCLLLWFQVPISVALRRIKKHKSLRSAFMKKYHVPLDISVLFRIRNAMEEPCQESFLVIDGTKSYQEKKKFVLKFLQSAAP